MAFEYIKDLGLKPKKNYTKRSSTQRVLVHHFASNSTIPAVHAYHQSLGHQGIDYNIVVDTDGQIYRGRGLDYCGGSVNNSNAKTKGYNNTSIAVALRGDLERNPMPKAQWEALCRVTRDLVRYYGLTGNLCVLGHDEAAGPGYTTCPGRHVDLSALRSYALGEVDSVDNVHPIVGPSSVEVPAIPPEYYKTHIVKLTDPYMRGDAVWLVQYNLNRHLANPGGIDGICGPNTVAAIKRFQQARINEGRDVGGPIVNGRQQPDGKVGYKTALILAE